MPSIAGSVGGVLGGFDAEYFRIATITVLHRVNVQGAEFACERFVLFLIYVLVAEDHHLPIQPRLIDLSELFIREGF